MHLRVIDSGSKGNCYILETEKDTYILDAGVDISRLAGKIDVKKTIKLLITHEHKDHIKHISNVIMICDPLIICSNQTKIFLRQVDKIPDYFFDITDENVIMTPLDHVYDTSYPDMPSTAFLIKKEKFLYATDFSGNKKNINALSSISWYHDVEYLLLSVVFDDTYLADNLAKLDKNAFQTAYFDRLLKSHLGLNKAIELLEKFNKQNLKEVIICHISNKTGNKRLFKEKIQNFLGNEIRVSIAEKNNYIELNKNK